MGVFIATNQPFEWRTGGEARGLVKVEKLPIRKRKELTPGRPMITKVKALMIGIILRTLLYLQAQINR
jgi:hypothetical protein